jgi:hypothetical protein
MATGYRVRRNVNGSTNPLISTCATGIALNKGLSGPRHELRYFIASAVLNHSFCKIFLESMLKAMLHPWLLTSAMETAELVPSESSPRSSLYIVAGLGAKVPKRLLGLL